MMPRQPMTYARTLTLRALLVSAELSLVPGSLQAQTTLQQAGDVASGPLDPTSGSAAAKAEFWAGIDDWQNFAPASAVKHFRRAVAFDPQFGLARAMAAGVDPQTLEEYRADDMSRGVARRFARLRRGRALRARVAREDGQQRAARGIALSRHHGASADGPTCRGGVRLGALLQESESRA